jgi:hypothetical protein
MQKIFSSMIAAIGRQLKQSVNVFQSLMLYRRLPAERSACGHGHNEGTRTLVVEAIDAVDTRALVVPAQDEEVFRVLDLVRKEQADRLERLLAAVDIVTQEQVVRLGREATVFEQSEEVIVLTVDIACMCGREKAPRLSRGERTDRRSLWVPRVRAGSAGL